VPQVPQIGHHGQQDRVQVAAFVVRHHSGAALQQQLGEQKGEPA
jgi:hypothetical protein